MELRQACTGFANALIVARGLIAVQPSAAVAISGAPKQDRCFFDPLRAAEETGKLINMMRWAMERRRA